MLSADDKREDLSRSVRVTILWTVVAVTLGAVVLLLPAIKAARERGIRNPCVSNLKQIAYACTLYAGDNGDVFPPTLGALYPEYVSYPEIFASAKRGTRAGSWGDSEKRGAPAASWGDSEEPGPLSPDRIAFCYVSGATRRDPPETILAFGEEWNHDGKGSMVALIGGQVYWEGNLERLHARLDKQAEAFRAQGREVKLIRPPWSRWPERPDLPRGQRRRVDGIGMQYGLLLAFAILAVGLAAIVSLRLLVRRRA